MFCGGRSDVFYKDKNHSLRVTALSVFVAWISLGGVGAEHVRSAEVAFGQPVSVPAIVARRSGLNLVSHSPLIARGQELGTVAIYDDPATRRLADYLELYDNGGGLVAIAWFDQFGIQRSVVDRALVEGGDELQGVLVAVLDGESI